jgi:hypothetical protein
MFLSFKIHSVLLYSSRCMRQCDSARKSYLIQLLVSHTFLKVRRMLYGTLRYDVAPTPVPDGRAYDTPRHVTTQGDYTLLCVLRALRAPAPRRAEQPRVTSRSGVLRAFRPSRAPLTARSGVGLSPSLLLTPRLESALQHLRSSRFGVAAPLLVVPRKSPRASSIAHRIWPSDATSSRLHVTLTAFSTMT